MDNHLRKGRFTSSQAYKLIKQGRSGAEFSAPGLTYIEEKQIEKRLNRCIDTGDAGKAADWGSFLEVYVYSRLEVGEYELSSKETVLHPKHFEFWAGSVDLKPTKDNDCVGEIKCYQLKKFAQYTDAILSKDIERIKKDFPDEYWQIVSNSCIHNTKYGEAISFAPNNEDMEIIRDFAQNYEGADQYKYRFIYEYSDSQLAVLPKGCEYESFNRFKFEVPQEDKDLLEQRLIQASEL